MRGCLRRLAVVLLVVIGGLTAAEDAPPPATDPEVRSVVDDPAAPPEPERLPGATPEQAWRVYQIFHRSCAECHNGQRGSSKGGFGSALDLEAMTADEDLMIPGDPDASELYLLIIDPDPEFVMPPVDADVPPLTEDEIQAVAEWIEVGGGIGTKPVPDDTQGSEDGGPGPVDDGHAHHVDHDPAEPEEGLGAWLYGLLGRFHPLLVHFPIALLIGALFAEAVSWLWPSTPGIENASRLFIWIAAIGGVVSAGSGWMNADAAGFGLGSESEVFWHRWLGVGTAAGALIALVVGEVAFRSNNYRARWIFRILLLILAVAVSIAGHTGGELVYGEGYPFVTD